MSLVTVPLIQCVIRRDANTITPVTVPPYEMTLLRSMFGKENVTGSDIVGKKEVEANGEFERMSAKYGQAKIIKVYGDDGGERLAELVEKAADTLKAAEKKAGTVKADPKKEAETKDPVA